jgi:hypothetical protein
VTTFALKNYVPLTLHYWVSCVEPVGHNSNPCAVQKLFYGNRESTSSAYPVTNFAIAVRS